MPRPALPWIPIDPILPPASYSRTAYHGNGGFWRGYPRNLGFSFFGWQPSPYFRVCKPSPPSQPWAQRRLAPYFRQATVALHPAHPHNLGLPMGLSECHLVFCTTGLPESKPPLATFGFLVTSSGLTPWIAVSSAHPRQLGFLFGVGLGRVALSP